jgi:peptidoglycan LD-endopeptidase CwlK
MALNTASQKKLAKVNPKLIEIVERASELSKRPFQIVQGNRTQAEQDALYAQGRTKSGPIVTWTRKSKHIGGNAIDFAALVGDKINWNDKYYPEIANAFKQAANELRIGIEWGGDWKTKDWGHVQLTGKNPTPTKPTSGIGWTMSDIQSALVQHGHDPGTIDGILGPKTRAAIKAFQKARGLDQTGGPNLDTLRALAKKPSRGLKRRH